MNSHYLCPAFHIVSLLHAQSPNPGLKQATATLLSDFKSFNLDFKQVLESEANQQFAAQLADICQIELTADDYDFIVSHNIVANGLADYAFYLAEQYLKIADIAVALNLEAIRGELGAFDDRLHSLARPYQGQIDSAYNVRQIIDGSQMTTDEGRYAFGYDQKPRVQDAISLRATAQTHGGSRDMLSWAKANMTALKANLSVHNFIVEYSANIVATGFADLANISERRTFRLLDPATSYGLAPNLAPQAAGLNHGYPVTQSNQAALLSELKLLALPNAAVKISNQPAAYQAVIKLIKILDFTAKVLAIEVLMSAQGMDIVKNKLPDFNFGKGTGKAWAKVREHVTFMTENRFMAPDMIACQQLINSLELLAAVNEEVSDLR